ncbi:hypothetical protein [Rhodococcus koreensis]
MHVQREQPEPAAQLGRALLAGVGVDEVRAGAPSDAGARRTVSALADLARSVGIPTLGSDGR